MITHQAWLIINRISQRKVIGDVAQYKRITLSNDEYMDITGPIIGNILQKSCSFYIYFLYAYPQTLRRTQGGDATSCEAGF